MLPQQPPQGHPTDEQLFDHAAGATAGDAHARIAHHLAGCAQCADLVMAAQAGAEAARRSATTMPADASERLHAAITAEQALRRPAAERSAAATTARGAARGGWRRWLVPAIAMGTLAALAGTSTWMGRDQPTIAPPSAPAPAESGDAGGVEAEAVAGGEATSTADGRAAQPADEVADAAPPQASAPEASTRGTGAPEAQTFDGDSAAGAGLEVAPTGAAETTKTVESAPEGGMTSDSLDGATSDPRSLGRADDASTECVVAFDGSAPELPGGRAPTTTTSGPLGLVIACG